MFPNDISRTLDNLSRRIRALEVREHSVVPAPIAPLRSASINDNMLDGLRAYVDLDNPTHEQTVEAVKLLCRRLLDPHVRP